MLNKSGSKRQILKDINQYTWNLKQPNSSKKSGDIGQRVETYIYKISSENLMHSILIIADNSILHTSKLIRE